jgi:hypothetical protein
MARALLGLAVASILLPLAACSGGGDAAQNDGVVELPEPSGPPVVQQVENGTQPGASENAQTQ